MAIMHEKNEQTIAAVLALENGQCFYGISIGVPGTTVGEVVFNTALTGYQEILTDPSYAKQLITLTAPHIGNVGCNETDQESKKVWASGLIVRDFSTYVSNWRATSTLASFLKQQHVVGIAQIDTRYLTQLIREAGALKACLTTETLTQEKAVQLAKDFSGLQDMDLAKVVGTLHPYEWNSGAYPEAYAGYHIVVIDFGVKRQILRAFSERGCRVTVVPPQITTDELLTYHPDGVVLANGPGDPAACHYAILCTQGLLEANIPILGICLGFQLLALACGAHSVKMKFGHHGSNHPVQVISTGSVLITAQNHGFSILEESLPPFLEVTHRSLFDGTLQGIRHREKPALGFQGHPEASPGPHDAYCLFDHFIELIDHYAKKK